LKIDHLGFYSMFKVSAGTVKYSSFQGTVCEKAHSNILVTLFSLILVHYCDLQLHTDFIGRSGLT